MDPIEIALRVIGAFYAFAGYVGTRAALASNLVDRAIAAIAYEKPSTRETVQSIWLLTASCLILAGGVMLILLIDLAAWVFLACALGQALYLYHVAPTYFDVEEAPDARGRQQSTNAFVLYAAVTAFVLWAQYVGKLADWRDMPWQVLAVASAVVIGYVAYVFLMFFRPVPRAPLLSAGRKTPGDPFRTKRVKVLADYDCHPLWALDEDNYGDFPPETLGLSEALTADLKAWADAYSASLNREDPTSNYWTEEQYLAHDAQARPLAVRLARERPDLKVYVVLDPVVGIIEVRGDEAI